MTKAIKFNLILDGKPVRDLDGLKENFNLDELIDYCKSGVLQRWLEVRGYRELFQKVSEIRRDIDVRIELGDELGIAKSLIRVFGVAIDIEEIKRASYKYQSKIDQDEILKKISESKWEQKQVIDCYHSGYTRLINNIIERVDDITFAKQALRDIYDQYHQLWLVDFNRAFNEFYDKSPLVLFAIVMDDHYKDLIMGDTVRIDKLLEWVPNSKLASTGKARDKIKFTEVDGFIELTFKIDSSFTTPDGLKSEPIEKSIKTPFKCRSKEKNDYWNEIEENGKEYLIINIEEGDLVHSKGKIDQELKKSDVFRKFPIIDGVEYKTLNPLNKLIYLEV